MPTAPPASEPLHIKEGRVRQNGIEFAMSTPLAPWTEMLICFNPTGDPANTEKVTRKGIVVDCQGNHRAGYTVSMVFVETSR